MNDNNKYDIISIISGKGGCGKTSIAVSLAKIVSESKIRTLLIDWDLSTHGLTYFFIDKIKNSNKLGVLEFLNSKSDNLYDLIYIYDDNFHIIPSKITFKIKSMDFLFDNYSKIELLFNNIIEFAKDNYELIIIDNQAGTSKYSLLSVKNSNKVLIVGEPDPFSVAANRSLDYEFSDVLPLNRKFLLNKIYEDELTTIDTITNYLLIFEHLTPIPFDFKVRQAFALGKIPVEDKKNTAFIFSIFRLSEEILETNTIDKILKHKNFIKSNFEQPINKRIEELKSEINKKEVKIRFKKNLILPLFMISATFIVSFIIPYFFFKHFDSYTIITIGSIFTAIISLIMSLKPIDTDNELKELKKELDSFTNLLIKEKIKHIQ